MFSYDSDAYRQFCRERADERASAYREARPAEREARTPRARMSRMWARFQRAQRAAAYRA